PGSLKPSFFAHEEPLLRVRRQGTGFRVDEVTPSPVRVAFVGVRACALAALAVQDRIFLHDHVRDAHYAARREHVLLIAVNCTRAASTCFCTSMGTGPQATRGHDLALTELDDVFLVESASPAGSAGVPAPLPEPAVGGGSGGRPGAIAAAAA